MASLFELLFFNVAKSPLHYEVIHLHILLTLNLCDKESYLTICLSSIIFIIYLYILIKIEIAKKKGGYLEWWHLWFRKEHS